MTNQQFVQQPAFNAAVNPPSRGFYLYDELPKAIQERLLYLQNTNGDWLRVSDGSTVLWMVALAFMCAVFPIFVVLFASSGIQRGNIIPSLVIGAIFLMWVGYLGWRVTQQTFSPIRNNLYLTPTQLIRVKNGHVSHRQLIDVREFHFLTIRGRGGPRYVLTCRLNDGESYKFVFTLGAFSSKTVEAKHWRDRAAKFRNAAIAALQRGDINYFHNQNVFQGLSEKEPAPQKTGRASRVLVILVLCTIVLTVLGSIAHTSFGGKSAADESWKSAVQSNTVTAYRPFMKSRGDHYVDASMKISEFYEADQKRLKSIRASASDPNGVDAILDLLQSAHFRQENEVILKITNSDNSIIAKVREQIVAMFRETLPHETLYIRKDSASSDSDNPAAIEITVTRSPEPPLTAVERRKRNDVGASRVEKFDFNCIIKAPGRPQYKFTVKALTPDGFKTELGKRLGLTETIDEARKTGSSSAQPAR